MKHIHGRRTYSSTLWLCLAQEPDITLGRVPAELHAQPAQQTANTAQAQAVSANSAAAQANSTATQAIREKDKIKKDAKHTLTLILPLVEASHRKVKTLGETVVPESGDLARALQEIEQLLERIS